jgi:hypothetical protein
MDRHVHEDATGPGNKRFRREVRVAAHDTDGLWTADAPCGHLALQGGKRGIEAPLERHHQRNPVPLDRRLDLVQRLEPQIERLLTEDGEASFSRGHDDLVVRVGWGRNHDGVEVVGIDDLTPVFGDAFNSQLTRTGGEGPCIGIGPGGHGRALDMSREILGVNLAHPARTEYAEAQRGTRSCCAHAATDLSASL